MEEVSNRTIAALLVVAMVISLSGTFFSLSKLNAVQQAGLTGFATNPNATANLTLQDVVSITFTTALIEWGTGSVNTTEPGNIHCNLTTLGYPVYSGCVGFVEPRPAPLVLENDGNRNVNVTIRLNQTPAEWIGGADPNAFVNASNNKTNSCNPGATFLNTSTAISDTFLVLCDNFTYPDDRDAINIDMRVVVPIDATAGSKTTRIEAQAVAI